MADTAASPIQSDTTYAIADFNIFETLPGALAAARWRVVASQSNR
jgi:hypothetical protein